MPRKATFLGPQALGILLLALGTGLLPVQSGLAGASPAKVLSLSEQGLGPVNGATPFNRLAVQKLLPGWIVADGQDSAEGEPFPILTVSDKSGLIATINPQEDHRSIYSIVLSSTRIKNALGPGLGTKYGAIYPTGVSKACQPEAEKYGGMFSCPAPGSQHIRYLFKDNTNRRPDPGMPPEPELRAWTIQLIYWRLLRG